MSTRPKHVAIIMDGNGRWATSRLHSRVWGHIRGANTVSKIVAAAKNEGIQTLTLYAFSTENWSRPVEEIQALFKLLKKYLLNQKEHILNNDIRFKVIGSIKKLDEQTQKLILDLEEQSAANSGMTLAFAFNYGGRQEIVDAVNKYIAANPGKAISQDDITDFSYLPEISNVDLLIRTAGEARISNFLLWQISYAEFYFTETKWPDFTASEFRTILDEISRRERRFGSLVKDGSLSLSQNFALQNLNVLTRR